MVAGNFQMKAKNGLSMLFGLSLAIVSPAQAAMSAQDREDIIFVKTQLSDFAEKMCGNIPLYSDQLTGKASAAADGEFNRLLTVLAKGDIHLLADVSFVKFHGLMQKDLPLALIHNGACKRAMANDLMNDIIVLLRQSAENHAPPLPVPVDQPTSPQTTSPGPLQFHRLITKPELASLTAANQNNQLIFSDGEPRTLRTITVECGGTTRLIADNPSTGQSAVIGACVSPQPWPSYGVEQMANVSLPAGWRLIWQVYGPSELWISYDKT